MRQLGAGREPWLRRLLGINVAPQVASIFNEAVRDNTAKQWNGVAARRTTRSDANNHRRYLVTRKRLDAAGCTGEPLLVIARNRVFLCILHCCMALRRLFVAFLEAQVGNHPPKVAGEVQKILYRNRCGLRSGAHNAPPGEEAHNLFWAWEHIAPLLAYVEEDPTWQAVVGLRTLLRTLYSPIPVVPPPSCRPVAAAFREHRCGESGSHFLLFLKEDCDAMLESADACGVPPPKPTQPKKPPLPPPKRKSFESGSSSSSDHTVPVPMGTGKGKQPQQQKQRKEPRSLEGDEAPDPLLGEQVYVPYTDGVYPGVATSVVGGGGGGGGESLGGTPRGKRGGSSRGMCCMPLMLQQ